MEKEWYTVTQTAENTNIPSDTVRRYIRQHRSYLKTRKRGHGYQIHINSLPIIHEIRRLYDEGMNVKDVDEQLSNVHPMTIELIDEHKQTRQTIDVALALHEMRESFIEVIEAQKKELQSVKEELAVARQEIQEVRKSDEQGKQTLNDLNNGINELMKDMNEKKKPWWSRRFFLK
ncbi:hypothetical protein [Priestia endophytica]|uniref:hypothetical protein n=1 Tax=Priestia endophytica TaxID=135735 RepID=UPI002282F44A|nr:hypothetical protein [Priestia endophytica]MCY8232000.1 helix-turn-helix domain-containing protein [Priestia endophytica]